MSERDHTILRAALESLRALCNAQMTEGLWHDAVNLRLRNSGADSAALAEFERARDFADRKGWVLSVTTALGNRRWCLSDRGRAALADLE